MKSNAMVDAAINKGVKKLASLPKSGPARTAALAKIVAEVYKEVGLPVPVNPKDIAHAA